MKKDAVTKGEKDWKAQLSPEQFHVLREKGTEIPFTGKLLNNKETGKYICAGCGAELFDSNAKFDSHCGWPSFFEANPNVGHRQDNSYAMQSIEAFCKKCGGHLGHVFDDGPQPTGKRYCINSLSLNFKKK